MLWSTYVLWSKVARARNLINVTEDTLKALEVITFLKYQG